MKAIDRRLLEIIEGRKQFTVPVFQRDYSWTEDEWNQLWNDVLQASGPQSRSGHFLGSIVYVGDGENAVFNRFQVIDGQQRLATILLLLTALRDHIGESGWTGTPTQDEIDDYYLKNRHEPSDRVHKLCLRRRDNTTLKSLIDKGLSAEVDDSSPVKKAYDYFRNALRAADPVAVYQGVGRLNVVDVSLKRKDDDPQLIFESLNSTGVALSQSDLIRNYLLMGQTDAKQAQLYEDYWTEIESDFRHAGLTPDRFLREYVALKSEARKALRDHEVYDGFKRHWSPSSDTSVDSLLAELRRFAIYYLAVVAPSKFPNRRSRKLSDALTHVRALGIVHAMLGMQLYDYTETQNLSEAGFVDALGIIESYVVRRSVLNWSSRSHWAVFASVARRLRATAEAKGPLEALRVAFAQQAQGFPSDEEFESSIQDINLYRRKNCHQILGRLENHGQREPSPVRDYTVEHIMPQSINDVPSWKAMLGEDWQAIHDTWLHRLGNLTLTGYNSSMSNRGFRKKKAVPGGFNDSAARLNRYVRAQEVWTQEQIEARGGQIAKRALEVWPHHGANEQLLREARTDELRLRAGEKNASSLNMSVAVRGILDVLLEQIRGLGEVVGVIEKRSICCYSPPDFFVEIIPMTKNLRLILPLELDEAVGADDLTVVDTSEWHWVQNRVHTECNVLVDLHEEVDAFAAMTLVRLALVVANSD